MDIAATTVRESVAAGELCNGPSKEEKQHLKSIPDYSLTNVFLQVLPNVLPVSVKQKLKKDIR